MDGNVGIIGAGHLAGYLVEGLRKAAPDLQVLVSDQDPERSGRLAFRWGAQAMAGNQALADATALILLAVRPEDAIPACRAIAFRPGQVVASAAANLPLAGVAAAVVPAQGVRVMPISSTALNESPTLLYPDHPQVHALFALLGRVHPLADEDSFTSASVVAAFYGWMYALVADTVAWTTQAGVPPATARSLVLETVRSAADMALAQPDRQITDMLLELATPGGITEHGLNMLRQRQGLAPWTEAMDAVLERMRGAR
jgi:pyrroline-5-carboxylate reductase